MGYIIRRAADIKPRQITCGLMRELTNVNDFKDASIIFVKINGETKKHYHKHTTEFYYVLNGKLVMELDNKKEECASGTLILIEPKTKHKAHGNANVITMSAPAWSADDEFVVE